MPKENTAKNLPAVTVKGGHPTAKLDSAVIMALLLTPNDERPEGWASKEAFAANLNSILPEAAAFVQKFEQFKTDSASVALHMFLAREQYKVLNPGKTDMEFIGEYFDPTCATMDQRKAARECKPYQALVGYLLPLARREITRQKDLKDRRLKAENQKRILIAASNEVTKGAVTEETRKQLQAASALGLAIPDALKPVLQGKAVEVTPEMKKTLHEQVAATTKAIDASVETPAAGNPRTGSTTESAAKAIAHARATAVAIVHNDKMSIEQKVSGITECLKTYTTELYKSLGRQQWEPVWKRGSEIYDAAILGQISPEQVPADTIVPATLKQVVAEDATVTTSKKK